MEKKEYKQPTAKVVEVEERILYTLSEDPDGTPTAKRGTLNFDTNFDTEE